jgi:hypothetical protein
VLGIEWTAIEQMGMAENEREGMRINLRVYEIKSNRTDLNEVGSTKTDSNEME